MSRRVHTYVLALCLFSAAGTPVRAADDAIPHKDFNAAIDQAVYDTINIGVGLYNSGDQAGCYRVYQGSLATLSPLLRSHPALKARVDAAMKEADAKATVGEKAFALRHALDAVLDSVRGKTAPTASAPKSLWDRLGGEPAVRLVVHDFVALAAGNPKVDFTRGGKYKIDADGVKNLENLLVELISSVSGGPLKYTGRDMKSSHQGMGITDAQFGAIAGDLIAVLNKYKVPKKEIDELVGIIASTKPDIVEAPRSSLPPIPSATPGAPARSGTLWQRLGGEPAVRAVVHDFVAKAAADPAVDFTRGGKYKIDADGVKNLENLLVELISGTSGGPLKYTGRDMKSSHEGMKITESQFNALAVDLVSVLEKFRVGKREIDELIAIIGSTRKDIVESK